MRPVPAAAALLIPFAAANAAPLDTAGASQCEVQAYATDRDPKGTNIRAAPRADAPIIGRLTPPTGNGPEAGTGAEFMIVGSKDGWLLIRKGKSPESFKLDADHAADGRGWISGRLAGATLGSRSLRAAPRRDAPVVAKLFGETWGPDSVAVSIIHACQGNYVEITGTPVGGKPLHGWTYSPCSNQLTTCDHGEPLD